MKEIRLNDTYQDVEICGNKYQLDINSFDAIDVLSRFKEKYINPEATTGMLDDCKNVIDTILGDGTYKKLFGEEKTMKAYLLVNELANIYLDLFMKEEREKKEAEFLKEAKKVNDLFSGFNQFAKTMQYAENKYGMKQHVSRKTSKKYKNRRN